MNPIDFHEKIIWHKFENGRFLANFVVYKEVALWWTVDEKFYEFLNPLIFSTNKKKRVKRSHTFISRIFKSKFGSFLFLLVDSLLFLFFNFIYIILLPIKKSRLPRTKPLLITIAHDNNWRTYIDYVRNKKKKSDYFLDPINCRLTHFATTLGIYPVQIFTRPISSFRMFVERVVYWDYAFKPFQMYWSPRSWFAQRAMLKYSRKHFNKISQDKRFQQKMIVNNFNYAPFILSELSYTFYYLLPIAISYIEIASKLIQKEKPSMFLMLNEYSLWERSVLIAAKIQNIPTMAIQHGEITKTHRGYMYSEKDISPTYSFRHPYCPLPDKIAVFGEYYEDLLTTISHFPKSAVIPTGQPRYDAIYFIKKYKDVKEIRKMFNLPLNKKILLWTTQTHGMPVEEALKNIATVYTALKEFPEIELIIKLHPSEDQKATLYKKNSIFRPKIFRGDTDTFLLLYASDIVMTKTSTTALEALAFEKPVIILNLSGLSDIVDYVSEGVALGAYNEENFKDAIRNILAGKAKLDENRQRYIQRKLYKIDGKASERVVSVVKSILNL